MIIRDNLVYLFSGHQKTLFFYLQVTLPEPLVEPLAETEPVPLPGAEPEPEPEQEGPSPR